MYEQIDVERRRSVRNGDVQTVRDALLRSDVDEFAMAMSEAMVDDGINSLGDIQQALVDAQIFRAIAAAAFALLTPTARERVWHDAEAVIDAEMHELAEEMMDDAEGNE